MHPYFSVFVDTGFPDGGFQVVMTELRVMMRVMMAEMRDIKAEMRDIKQRLHGLECNKNPSEAELGALVSDLQEVMPRTGLLEQIRGRECSAAQQSGIAQGAASSASRTVHANPRGHSAGKESADAGPTKTVVVPEESEHLIGKRKTPETGRLGRGDLPRGVWLLP